MPIPSPNKNEKKNDFIGRCMQNENMIKEYPNEKKQAAVCHSQWDEYEKNKLKGVVIMKIMMPTDNEKMGDFMDRCMKDGGTKDECKINWDKKEGGARMDTKITKVEFQAAYPDLFTEIQKEVFDKAFSEGMVKGKEEGLLQGAESERKRIQDVETQCIPGHEAIILSLKYDGKTTGPEAAVKVLAAEKEVRVTFHKDMRDGAVKPVIQPAVGAGEPIDMNDFESEVKKYEDTHKCKHSEAIVAIANEKPEIHEAWLKKINKK